MSDAEKAETIHMWLGAALPDLSVKDKTAYASKLLDDGFDTLELLSSVHPSDLEFMKKGHKRAITTKYALSDPANELSPAKKIKDIKALLASQEFNNHMQEPRKELFGRDEAKETVIKYIKECTSKDKNVFMSGKFEMLAHLVLRALGRQSFRLIFAESGWKKFQTRMQRPSTHRTMVVAALLHIVLT